MPRIERPPLGSRRKDAPWNSSTQRSSGSAGLALGGALADDGQNIVVVEQSDTMYGGACVNNACIPTKALVESARLTAAVGGPIVEREERYTAAVDDMKELRSASRERNYRALADRENVDVIDGRASFADATHLTVATASGTRSIEAKRIFIDTGSLPKLPSIPGIDSPRAFVSSSLIELPTLPRQLVIIGGGYVGLEFASFYTDFGAQVTILNDQPDGININENCGSTHIAALGEYVKKNGYDVGVAFDGDADRCLAVDENGELVDGDKLIAIFAQRMKQEGRLANDTAVVTVMSNIGFFKFAEQAGIHVEKTGVGDRYVLQNMLENGHLIGGEQSGHIILREYMTTGDGQLTAVQLLDAMKKDSRPLSQIASLMRVYPQVLLNVRGDREKLKALKGDPSLQELEEQMQGNGRILVRPSGTEPVVRIMVEGPEEKMIMDIAKAMEQTIIERLGQDENC